MKWHPVEKKRIVSLQKLPYSAENILRFEEFSLGKIPYKAQENWKETHLAFCFRSSSANMYLAPVFSANYLFYMEAIYFETTEFEGRWVREGPKAAVPFGLISVQGIAAGWAMRVSCLLLLQPPLFTGEPSTKHLVQSTCTRLQVLVYIFCGSFADASTLWPRVGHRPPYPNLSDIFEIIFSHTHFPILQCFWADRTGNSQFR